MSPSSIAVTVKIESKSRITVMDDNPPKEKKKHQLATQPSW